MKCKVKRALALSAIALLMLAGVSYSASLPGSSAFSPADDINTPTYAAGVGHIQSGSLVGLSFSPIHDVDTPALPTGVGHIQSTEIKVLFFSPR